MSNFTKLKLCHNIGISQSTHLWMTGIFTLLLLFIPGSKAKAADVPSTWKSVSFNDGIRYSQWVINSRISDFYGNKTQRGFNTYDASGNKIGNSKGTQDFDYVPGLVAKAILEAYANYSTFDWSKPWFYSVMNYAKDNSYTKKTSEKGITLDNMNACKMYFPLMESGVLDNSAASTGANTITAVIDNLKTYNTQYVIGGSESGVASSTNETVKSMFGGWFHKPAYTDQMWCDGLYMGAALLAQIINYKNSVHNITASTDKSDDWDLIAKQFTISWKQLYNNSKGLLYHAFTANPKDDASSAWTGISNTTGSEVYHSEAFWGRAIGWYFLALVDVLEQMPSGNKNRETLRGYLQNLASGLAKYQDAETGCWYQVIDEKDNNLTGNYLESSCTCLFAAAYLKAVRLELLPTGGEYNYKTIGENAFKGAVNQFMKCDTFGPTGATVQLVHNCASAGLGGDKKRSGSRDYYINGSDVGQTNTYTEGKVMGAFIMAATEYEKANPKSIRLSSDLAPSYSLTKGESIKVEASGEGSASYQWYDAKTSKDVSGATDASFAPEASGSYYCKITPASTSAKTRATSDEFITTGVTQVTVSKAVASSDIFSLSITYDKVYSLASGSDLNLTSEYATVTGGSVKLTNGKKEAQDMISGGQINLNGSSGSYIYIKLNQALQEGDEIVITPATSTFKLSNSSSNENATSICSTYTIKTGDNFVGKTEIYLFKTGVTGESATIETITISRPNPGADSRATFTYGGSPLTFTENSGGTYTTTLEVGASKRNKEIAINATVNDGATIKEGTKEVTSPITITAPSTTGTTETHTYTVTSKDGSTATTYVINVKVVKEKITLVYSDTDDKTEWTWNSTTTPAQPKFNQPTVKAYTKGTDGKDVILTNETLSYEYESDVLSVATVTEKGVISLVKNANGGAKIYATLVDNDNYYADPTFFNVIIEQGYSFSVGASETAPEINTSRYITGANNENLVKMTFGGWKWEGLAKADATTKTLGSYKVVRGDKTTYYTDKWNDSGTKASDIASIDGHYYWWNGQNDAVDESKAASDGYIYGSTRYGWFKSPEHDGDGKTTVSYPFTLPVRGSYMTFEPTMNGTLTIYILQNGAWNTNNDGGTYEQGTDGSITYKKGDIIPGVFRPHAFQVVNQRGLTVQEFSPNYSVSTKQKVDSRYYCMLPEDKDYNETKYNNPYNVAKWTEFADYMSTKEQNRAHDSWNSGPLGAQKIIELDNGSFLAVQKGIVKYTFHVTGNETYYFFSNFSKMGFSGANFVPDVSQPQETVSNKISTLELSDVTAYNKITATPKNSNIEGTELKDYTYTIGGKEIAPVAGVYIPQFYSIKLKRTFKPNQWTTLSLPFNLTQTEVEQIFGTGTQIIVFDKANPTSARIYLTFFYHEIQNVLPGYPYLIRPTLKYDNNNSSSAGNAPIPTITDGNLTAFTVYNKAINPAIKPHEFKSGDYTAKCTPSYCTPGVNNTNYSILYGEDDIFVSEKDGTVYISEGKSYGKGYRSYIDYTGTTTTSAKALSISFSGVEDGDDNGTTTEIRVTELADDVIETLGIGGVYNLNGQKVADTTRNLPAGIYIVNGRKVVVK